MKKIVVSIVLFLLVFSVADGGSLTFKTKKKGANTTTKITGEFKVSGQDAKDCNKLVVVVWMYKLNSKGEEIEKVRVGDATSHHITPKSGVGIKLDESKEAEKLGGKCALVVEGRLFDKQGKEHDTCRHTNHGKLKKKEGFKNSAPGHDVGEHAIYEPGDSWIRKSSGEWSTSSDVAVLLDRGCETSEVVVSLVVRKEGDFKFYNCMTGNLIGFERRLGVIRPSKPSASFGEYGFLEYLDTKDASSLIPHEEMEKFVLEARAAGLDIYLGGSNTNASLHLKVHYEGYDLTDPKADVTVLLDQNDWFSPPITVDC